MGCAGIQVAHALRLQQAQGGAAPWSPSSACPAPACSPSQEREPSPLGATPSSAGPGQGPTSSSSSSTGCTSLACQADSVEDAEQSSAGSPPARQCPEQGQAAAAAEAAEAGPGGAAAQERGTRFPASRPSMPGLPHPAGGCQGTASSWAPHKLMPLGLALVLALALCAPPQVSAQGGNSLVNSTQLPAMQALNTSFPVNNGSWRAAIPCNQWLGVVCDNKGNVQSISLSLYNQASPPSLPSQVGSLIYLTYLQVNGGLQGSLPSTLSSLRALQFLDLTENTLNGTFSPPSTLTALSTLSINNNRFTGSVPSGLTALTALVQLLLGDNRFSGTIPNVFAPLARLKALDLSDNWLSGAVPPNVTTLPQLVFLDLSNNQLSGPAPTQFLSTAMGTTDATYRINGNYFSGSPVTTVPQNNGNGNSKTSWFCPLLLQGGYALRNLMPFGCKILSSSAQNCFDSSTDPWNSTLGANSSSRVLLSREEGGSSSSSSYSTVAEGGGDLSGEGVAEHMGFRVRGRMLASKKIPPGQLKKWQDLFNAGGVASLLSGPWGRGRRKGFKGSYGNFNGSSSLCFFESQKTPQMCAAFCNALDPKGPCAGLGRCAQDTGTLAPNCTCNSPALFTYSLSSSISYFDNTTKRGVPSFPSCTTNKSAVYFPPTGPVTKYSSTPSFTAGLQVNPNATAPSIPNKFNKYFRHFSVGFQGSYASPSWDFPSNKDWRTSLGPFNQSAISSVKDQKTCAACWVFSAAGAVESALAIMGMAVAPNVSAQQVLDCVGTGNCQGGNPADALNYFAYTSPGVSTDAAYPYTATKGTCKVQTTQYRLLLATREESLGQSLPSGQKLGRGGVAHRRLATTAKPPPPKAPAGPNALKAAPASPYITNMYEQASASGWFGILQAVQVQPVVADVEGDQPSFIAFTGGFVYNDPSCFVNQILTHSLLVVGYDLTAAVPFWILKNSWGTNWGEAGYMRLAIQGGYGICGINYTPVRYPVVTQASTPCGPINPCGGGTCVASAGGSNTCSNCPSNFMPVTNLDGSQSCGPAFVCNLFDLNPCGVGTCVDDGAGGYSCLCPPPSYTNGTAASGNPTCVPGNSSSSLSTKPGMTCDMIRTTYSLSSSAFAALNPTVNCNTIPLPPGTRVNVSNPSYAGCQLYYSVSTGDTCDSIQALFGQAITTVNPDLNCSALTLGEQVCVQAGTPLQYLCTQYYAVAPGDSCSSIALTVADPPLPPQSFYAFNPGLICSNLQPTASSSGLSLYSSLFGTQVCTSAVPANVTTGLDGAVTCSYGTYFVLSGDTCVKVYTKIYCSKPALFLKYNGFSCTDGALYVNRPLCKPYKTAAGVCS